MVLTLAPGTEEGEVMVVSTKPHYTADAPSLIFEKKFWTLSPRGECRVFVVKHYAPSFSKGRVQGVCFSNTLHLFEAPCMHLCLLCGCVKTVLYLWYVYLNIAVNKCGPICSGTVHKVLHFIHIIVMFTLFTYLKFDIFANKWKYSLCGTMRSCTRQYIEKYVAI